jgi:hypothetical protein
VNLQTVLKQLRFMPAKTRDDYAVRAGYQYSISRIAGSVIITEYIFSVP